MLATSSSSVGVVGVVVGVVVVVVAVAMTATWLVQRGDTEAAPKPTPSADQNRTIDGWGPATPSNSPSASASVTGNPTTGPGTPAGTVLNGPAALPTSGTGVQPELVGPLRDDFVGTTLDDQWGVYSSTDSRGGIKSANQVRVSNGELQILGQGANPSGKGNRSGGMCWCGDGDRLYGVWQVRARFDAGAGYGQHIGLWPASDNGKADGHISLAISNGATKNLSWHSLTAPGGKAKGGRATGNFTQWHVYAVEWRASFVRVSIDNKAVFDSRTNAPGLAIPSTAQHLILQQDLGPTDSIPAPNSGTPSTAIMHVDWASYTP